MSFSYFDLIDYNSSCLSLSWFDPQIKLSNKHPNPQNEFCSDSLRYLQILDHILIPLAESCLGLMFSIFEIKVSQSSHNLATVHESIFFWVRESPSCGRQFKNIKTWIKFWCYWTDSNKISSTGSAVVVITLMAWSFCEGVNNDESIRSNHEIKVSNS